MHASLVIGTILFREGREKKYFNIALQNVVVFNACMCYTGGRAKVDRRMHSPFAAGTSTAPPATAVAL